MSQYSSNQIANALMINEDQNTVNEQLLSDIFLKLGAQIPLKKIDPKNVKPFSQLTAASFINSGGVLRNDLPDDMFDENYKFIVGIDL